MERPWEAVEQSALIHYGYTRLASSLAEAEVLRVLCLFQFGPGIKTTGDIQKVTCQDCIDKMPAKWKSRLNAYTTK